MVKVKRIVLDVLKPHHPDALEFSGRIAMLGKDYRVRLSVLEMDENTQTLKIVVEAGNVDFSGIQDVITQMGASLHSIDEVEVVSAMETDSDA